MGRLVNQDCLDYSSFPHASRTPLPLTGGTPVRALAPLHLSSLVFTIERNLV